MPRLFREHPFTVTVGSGSGANALFAAGLTSAYVFTKQRMEAFRDGLPTYLRGLKVKLALTVYTVPQNDVSDVFWNICDDLISLIEIDLGGINKKAPWRDWLRRTEQYTNMKRHGILPQITTTLTTYIFETYIPLNAPLGHIMQGETDFPVCLMNDNDKIIFHYSAGALPTNWSMTGGGLTMYVYPDVIVKPKITVPYMEKFEYVDDASGTVKITKSRRMYTNINVINPSYDVNKVLAANGNQYATVELKHDGYIDIESAYPGWRLHHWDMLDSKRVWESHVFGSSTYATPTFLGIMDYNGYAHPVDVDIPGDIVDDDYIQPVYNVPTHGKLSYALAVRDNLEIELPNPTTNNNGGRHHIVLDGFVPNKEIEELNQRIFARGGKVPVSPGWNGKDITDVMGVFSPFDI